MKKIIISFLTLCLGGILSITTVSAARGADAAIRLETNTFAIEIEAKGTVSSLIDKQTGKNWLRPKFEQRFCVLYAVKEGPALGPRSIEQNGDLLKVTFVNGAVATLKWEKYPKYLTLEVVSVETPDHDVFYKLEFGRAFTAIKYEADDTFAVSSFIMNINTNLAEISGLSNRLGGVCFSEIGYKGAKIAIMGTPIDELRDALKTVFEDLLARSEKDPAVKESLPVLSRTGGPYAMDQAKSHGNYIVNPTPIVADDTDKWADHLKQFGVDQINFHQGGPFMQADFAFNEKAYPNGVSDFRKMTDAFRQKGIICGLHTYATCVPMMGSKYVQPVPHKDFSVIESFTLAEDMTADATSLRIAESVDHISIITGYMIWNSLVLRIDDELIKYTNIVKDGKNQFVECKRGMYGTTKAAHSKGTAVRHIGILFNNYFAPHPGSELYFQIARDTAKAYDEGGFQIIYLDALDGNRRTIKNKDLVWYYDALFVREILRNIKTESPLLEYSTMHASLWGARSRMGAWDTPCRGFIQFLDTHIAENNKSANRRFLPGQLGWMELCPSAALITLPNFQRRYFYPEEIEYMGTKALAWDQGMSYCDILLQRVKPGAIAASKTMKQLDDLRRQNYFSDSVRKQLREPRKHFSLQKRGNDWFFRQAEYPANKLIGAKNEVEVVNHYVRQRPTLRIENLHAVAPYNSEQGFELIAFDETKTPQKQTTVKFEDDNLLDLRKTLGMGMWIYGEAKGQVVNVCVQSPHYLFSGIAEHFVKIDFTGWKYIAWAEAETGMYPDVSWPIQTDAHGYIRFRNHVRYDKIYRVDVMVNGDPSGLKFRSLKALPVAKSTLTNPKVTLGGSTLSFSGSIPNGCWMLYTGGNKVPVFNRSGEILSEMTVSGTMPVFKQGENNVTVESTSAEGFAAPRTLWTWGFLGEKIK